MRMVVMHVGGVLVRVLCLLVMMQMRVLAGNR
jgi:hypothetical protein